MKSIRRTLFIRNVVLVDNDGIEEKVITIKEEVLEPRVCTAKDPLAATPLIEGGCVNVQWCDKHLLNRAGVHCTNMLKQTFQLVQSFVRFTRSTWVFTKLRNAANAVLQIAGYQTLPKHQAVIDALGPNRVEQMRLNNPNGLVKIPAGIDTRWMQLQDSAGQVAVNLQLFAAITPLALAEGTEDNKIQAAVEVCSREGFHDKKTIVYSDKIGKHVFLMNSPSFIIQVAVARFINLYGWRPIFRATADFGECSSLSTRGVGSLIRVVLHVFRRELLGCVQITRTDSDKLPGSLRLGAKMWNIVYRLAHHGDPVVECLGNPWLSTRIERAGEKSSSCRACTATSTCSNCNARASRSLQRLYGPFFTDAMLTGVTDLLKVFTAASQMKSSSNVINVLPKELRSSYDKEQSTFAERVAAAQWSAQQAMNLFVCTVEKKMGPVVNDPLGFLAGMVDVQRLPFEPGQFEPEDTPCFVIAATRTALANGAVLYAQMQELLQKHQQLPLYVNDPLRSLMKEAMPELAEFIQGTELACTTSGRIIYDPNLKHPYCAWPVHRYAKLCRLAHMAAGRPTNNNAIESKWSIVTQSHNGGQRVSKPEHLSSVFRKKDIETLGIADEFTTDPKFKNIFAEARKFRRENIDGYKAIFRLEHTESEDRLACSKRARETYTHSKIIDPEATRQGKTKKADNLNRTKGRPKRRDEPLSSSKSDSESSDTSHHSSCEDSGEEDSGEQEPVEEDSGEQEPGGQDDGEQEPGGQDSGEQEPGGQENREKESPDSNEQEEPGEEEGEESDESDLDSEFDDSASDSDMDKPLLQRASQKGSSSQDIWRNPGSHPLPILKELTRQEAQSESRFKLSYIRFLLRSEKWKDTKINEQPLPRGKKTGSSKSRAVEVEVKKATLTRQDGLSFELVPLGVLFYALYEYTGIELIYVQRIFWGTNEYAGQLCVEYRRVLSTKEASEICKDKNDLETNMTRSDGSVVCSKTLGKRSLEAALAKQKKNTRRTFHRGDFPFVTPACNIVGFVAWSSVGDDARFVSLEECQCMEADLLPLVQRTQKIKKMTEIDWVFCAGAFSDDKDALKSA